MSLPPITGSPVQSDRGGSPRRVAASSPQRPEQLGVFVRARAHDAPVGRDEVGADDVVARQPMLRRQVPDAPPRARPPRRSTRRRGPAPDPCDTVAVSKSSQSSRFRASDLSVRFTCTRRMRDRRSRGRRRERNARPGCGPLREPRPRLVGAREAERGRDVGASEAAEDDRGPPVDERVKAGAGTVVLDLAACWHWRDFVLPAHPRSRRRRSDADPRIAETSKRDRGRRSVRTDVEEPLTLFPVAGLSGPGIVLFSAASACRPRALCFGLAVVATAGPCGALNFTVSAAAAASLPWVVFSAHPRRGTTLQQLFRVQSEGHGLQQNLQGRGPTTEPRCWPDGKRVVFVRLGKGRVSEPRPPMGPARDGLSRTACDSYPV